MKLFEKETRRAERKL
jgi:hypothetical protein